MKELARNRKAYHDFQVLEAIEAGIALVGTEVKSCRANEISMVDAFARILSDGVYLYNVHINEFDKGNRFNHEPTRARKLLLHKNEIRKLNSLVNKGGLTLVPLSFYLKGQVVKVQLGVCRGKTKGDKRQGIRKREADQAMRRVLRARG